MTHTFTEAGVPAGANFGETMKKKLVPVLIGAAMVAIALPVLTLAVMLAYLMTGGWLCLRVLGLAGPPRYEFVIQEFRSND